LLGLLPRSERLEFVASLQARLESQPAESITVAEDVSAVAAEPRASTRRRRSAMALTAGVLGIVALVLLFALPLTYLIVVATGEALGEMVAYALLAANVLIVALGGGAAVVLGIVALARLGRRRGQLGHGWAITGLCTGPLPALVGGLATIVVVFPLMAELADSGNSFPVPSAVGYVSASGDAPVAVPVQVVANSPYAAAPASPWSSPAPLPPSAPSSDGTAPTLSPVTSDAPPTLLTDTMPPPSSRDDSESTIAAPSSSALPAELAPAAALPPENPAAVAR
jgi:hypothetical protein